MNVYQLWRWSFLVLYHRRGSIFVWEHFKQDTHYTRVWNVKGLHEIMIIKLSISIHDKCIQLSISHHLGLGRAGLLCLACFFLEAAKKRRNWSGNWLCGHLKTMSITWAEVQQRFIGQCCPLADTVVLGPLTTYSPCQPQPSTPQDLIGIMFITLHPSEERLHPPLPSHMLGNIIASYLLGPHSYLLPWLWFKCIIHNYAQQLPI